MGFDIQGLSILVGYASYGVLTIQGLWGAFCAVMVWLRVSQQQFRTEQQQDEFLATLEQPLARGDFQSADQMLDGNRKAIAQLTRLALLNRQLGFANIKQMVFERFKRDVLDGIDFYLSWVNSMIKTGPMVGLFGTVIGMMGAFQQLAGAEQVKPADLASNIAVALITTAMGLMIAIPLMVFLSAINLRIKRMEDFVGSGVTRTLAALKSGLGNRPAASF